MRILGCITGMVIVATVLVSMGLVPGEPVRGLPGGGLDRVTDKTGWRTAVAGSHPAASAESPTRGAPSEYPGNKLMPALPAPTPASDENDGAAGVADEAETAGEPQTIAGDPDQDTTEIGDDTSIPEPVTSDEESWEAFFTPFRSQASAEGFARFLGAATGHEFRVARAGPGQYRVWFRIEEGESLPQRIAEIEAVTGMNLQAGDL